MGCGATKAIVRPSATMEADGSLSLTWRSQGLHSVTTEQLRSSVGAPAQLKSLRLPKNFLKTLPLDLHALFPELDFLDLSSNGFQKLPPTVGSLTNLTTIILDNNTLDSPNALANLPQSISRISLVCCSLHGFPDGLRGCRNLTSLDLSRTIVPLGDRHVFANLSQTLRSLRVAECQLKTIPLGIQELEALTCLDVSGNTKLSFSDVDMFGTRLQKTLIEFKACNLFKRRLPSMFTLRELTKVDLSGTPIIELTSFVSSEPTPHARSSSTASNTSSSSGSGLLGSIDSLNSLTPARLELVCMKQSCIEELILSGCGISALPAGLGHFERLTFLDLSLNDGLKLDRKKRSLLKLINLTHIKLVGCDSLLATDGRDNFWFQLAALPRLSVVELHAQDAAALCNPRTSLPVQLLYCPLTLVDGFPVDDNMCCKGLRSIELAAASSKFKPDFLFGIGSVESFVNTVSRLACLESFFIDQQRSPSTTRTKRLQTSVWRYAYFLVAQSQQEAIQIVPPLDVALIHLAHALIAPEDYNAICRELPSDRTPAVVEPLAISYLKSLEQPFPQAWNELKKQKEEVLHADQNLLQFDYASLQGDVSEPRYERTVPSNLLAFTRQRLSLFDNCLKSFFALTARLSPLRGELSLERTMDRRFAQYMSTLPQLGEEHLGGISEKPIPTADKDRALVPPPDVELALALHRSTPVRHINLLRLLRIAHPAWNETDQTVRDSAVEWLQRFGEGYKLHDIAEIQGRVRFAQ